MRTITTSILAATLLLAPFGAASAGQLDPPPGPPASSGPTLTELADNVVLADTVSDLVDEADDVRAYETRIDVHTLLGDASHAFIIEKPGSYFLSRGISVGSPNMVAILIDSDNVTLDLNGHTVESTTTNDNSYGIESTLGITRTNIVVRNGTVLDFEHGAIRLRAQASRLENLVLIRDEVNGNPLVTLSGGRANMIIGCRAQGAGDSGLAVTAGFTSYGNLVAESHIRSSPIGFSMGRASVYRDCTVVGLTLGTGFNVNYGSVLRRCSVFGSPGNGFSYTDGRGCVLADCSAAFCGADGFRLLMSSAFRCRAETSGGDGFYLRSRCHVLDCTSIDADDAGFLMDGQGSRVQGCHAVSLTNPPQSYGFLALQLSDSCMVVRNTAAYAFDPFGNTAVNPSLFAADWSNMALAGPWDNLWE